MKRIRDVLIEVGLSDDRLDAVIKALPVPDADRWNPDPSYLRELLEQAGLSQRRAAELLGVNTRQMRHFCTGKLQAPYTVQYGLEMLAVLKNGGLRDESPEGSENG